MSNTRQAETAAQLLRTHGICLLDAAHVHMRRATVRPHGQTDGEVTLLGWLHRVVTQLASTSPSGGTPAPITQRQRHRAKQCTPLGASVQAR